MNVHGLHARTLQHPDPAQTGALRNDVRPARAEEGARTAPRDIVTLGPAAAAGPAGPSHRLAPERLGRTSGEPTDPEGTAPVRTGSPAVYGSRVPVPDEPRYEAFG